MRLLPPSLQIAFADLVDSVHDQTPPTTFPKSGSFYRQKRGRKEYWYLVMRDPTAPTGRRSVYAGVVGDPALEPLVAAHGHKHARHRLQKETASLLRRAGLSIPNQMTGNLTKAFDQAGVFRSGVVLVGHAAYLAYGGILGVKLRNLRQVTGVHENVELAGDRLMQTTDVETILRSVDASFQSSNYRHEPSIVVTRFENAAGDKVDLLASREYLDIDQSGRLPDTIAPSATDTVFDSIGFLIKYPIRSTLLYREGVAVMVPEPARYALYELFFREWSGRHDNEEAANGSLQYVVEIIRALELAGRTGELANAWSELWSDVNLRNRGARALLDLPEDVLGIVGRSAFRYGEPPFEEDEAFASTLKDLCD